MESTTVSQDALIRTLEQHQLWLKTNSDDKPKGMRADLSGADLHSLDLRQHCLASANLEEADLQGSNLEGADLHDSNLTGANFLNANLSGANLRAANLCHANLKGANLSRIEFGEANLTDATIDAANLECSNLRDVKGLIGDQLSGTDLRRVKLPEDICKFESLNRVDELSKNAGVLFLSMLLSSVYTWLTIATTTDIQLLTNSVSSKLPVIQTEIPIVGFYFIVPVLLVGLYIYFHLYLRQLWEVIACLPAVFPDGVTVDRKMYPWLINGFAYIHVRRLQGRQPPFSWLQALLSVLLAWWITPITLLLCWGRYLRRQDWIGINLQLLLFAVAVWIGISFYHLAIATLQRNEKEISYWAQPWKTLKHYQRGAGALALAGVLWVLSWGAMNGFPAYLYRNDSGALYTFSYFIPPNFSLLDPQRLVPWVGEKIGYEPFVNFMEADVSVKPDDWMGKDSQIHLVRGAQLSRANLRFAYAGRAFLVKSDLRGARLWGAYLDGADLREADFYRANLTQANLMSANLKGANFYEAEMTGAWLMGAEMEGTNLTDATLIAAHFRGNDLKNLTASSAKMQGADLMQADLRKANFNGTELQNAHLFQADIREADLSLASLQGADLRGANLQKANMAHAELRKADFSSNNIPRPNPGAPVMVINEPHVQLRGADLRGANLEDANLSGADLLDTNLCGVDLTKTIGLTQKQFQQAFSDDKTKLPAHLHRTRDKGIVFKKYSLE